MVFGLINSANIDLLWEKNIVGWLIRPGCQQGNRLIRGMGGISRGGRIWVFAWTDIQKYIGSKAIVGPSHSQAFCCVYFQSHQLARFFFWGYNLLSLWKHLDRTTGCYPCLFVLFTQLYLPLKKFLKTFVFCLPTMFIELLSHYCRSFAYLQTNVS